MKKNHSRIWQDVTSIAGVTLVILALWTLSGCDPMSNPKEPELVTITVATPPVKTVYVRGEALDLTGLVVIGTYDDESTKVESIAVANVSGYNKDTLGEQILTVTVNGKTASFKVTVNAVGAPVLEFIRVTTPPTKTVYTQGEALDLTGLVVTGIYSDESTKVETITAANVSGYNKDTLGEQSITVTVNGKTASFKVVVYETDALVLVFIEITTPPTKTVYTQGEDLDLTGLVVTGAYSDGSTKSESVMMANISGYNKNSTGEQLLTVTVGGRTATFQVTVNQAELVSIMVTTPPTKTVYAKGEDLDLIGLVVTGTYNNGSTKAETITAANVSGYNKDTLGEQTLTVTVNGKTASFKVTVNAAVLVSIVVTTPPTKTAYTKGETLDITGMVVTGTYSDNSTKAETITAANVSGYNKDTLGEQTLTVTVNGKTATFTVTVKLPMNLAVEFNGAQDETIGISQNTSVVKGTAITIAVTQTFDSYQWYLDGNIVAGAAGKSLEIPTANLTFGSHNVTVLVKKGTTPYTKLLYFQVTR